MERTEIQVLLNEPVTVVVGTKEQPIRVEIKEPMQDDLGRYLTVLNLSLRELFTTNRRLVEAAWSGKSTDGIDVDLAPLSRLFTQLVACVMERDEEFVRKNVSPRQQAVIVENFLSVLGWEYLKELFSRATTALMKMAASKNGSDAAPSWSRESSSTSPERTPN